MSQKAKRIIETVGVKRLTEFTRPFISECHHLGVVPKERPPIITGAPAPLKCVNKAK